jgi:O-antigen/teichoic acid export membrane protein
MKIKNTYINKVLQSKLIRSTGVLLSGNVLAQAITLLAYPVITRLYAPDEMGTFNLFVSIFSIFVLLANAEYHQVLVFHKEKKDLPAVMGVCVACVLLVSGVAWLTVPFSGKIAELFNAPNLRYWYWILPIYVAATALWNICDSVLVRSKQFRYISLYLVLLALLNAVLKITLGYGGFGIGSLFVSALLSSVVVLVFVLLYAHAKEGIFNAYKERPNLLMCKTMAVLYSKFPTYSMTRKGVNLLSKALPVFILSAHFGMTQIGLFTMGLLLAHTPINVLCGSLYKTLFRHVSEKVAHGQTILPIIKKYVGVVLLLGIPFFALLYLILPDFTVLLLGEPWRASGHYIRLMLPWLLAFSIFTVLDFLPELFNKQEGLLWFEIITLVLGVMALCVGVYVQNFVVALALYLLMRFVMYVAGSIWLIRLARTYEEQL